MITVYFSWQVGSSMALLVAVSYAPMSQLRIVFACELLVQ